MATAKKRPSARRREPLPHWSDILTRAAEVVLDHIAGPERERSMTITAYVDEVLTQTGRDHEKMLGDMHLPITEAANWSMDAIAKFPTATRFRISGRNGYSHEVFDVRNGRVYEVATLGDMHFDQPQH